MKRGQQQRPAARKFWRYGTTLSLLGVIAVGCAAQDEGSDMPSGGSGNISSSGTNAGGSAGSSAGNNTGTAGNNSNGGNTTAGSGGSAAGSGGTNNAGSATAGNGGSSNGGNGGGGGAGGSSGSSAGSGGKGGAGGSAGASGSSAGAGGKGGAGGTGGSAGMSGGGTGGSGGTPGCSLVTDCATNNVCEASKCRARGCNATNCAYDLTRFIIGTPVATSARGQVFVDWDATKLDLDFQILDNTAQNDSGNNWEDDSVEIYLDLNNAGAATYDADDFQINIPRDAGTLVGLGNVNFASITVTRTENANGYQIKVSVPWTALNGAASQVGKTIGFDVAVNDDRDGATRETQVMLYGFDQNYLNTSQFGDLMLTP